MIEWVATAQLPQDLGITGGWAASGLLGLVLGWLLLKHLPEKDRMILNLIDSRDKQANEQRQDFSSTIKRLGESVQATVDRITTHCKEELEVLTTKLGTSMDKMEEALATVIAQRQARAELDRRPST